MNPQQNSRPVARAEALAAQLGIRLPVLLAPMAGACPPSLSIAVANAGGMGACGALLMKPDEIAPWCAEFRQESKGEFQLNLWIPGPHPARAADLERRQREFLSQWGPPVSENAAEGVLPDFEAQCETMLEARPKAISSIMGLYPPSFVAEMKARGILWFATATTVGEARAAEAAGAMPSSRRVWKPADTAVHLMRARRNGAWLGYLQEYRRSQMPFPSRSSLRAALPMHAELRLR